MNTTNDKSLVNFELWAYLKAFIMLLAIALGWLIVGRSELASLVENPGWVKDRVEEIGWYGPILFIAISGMGTVIGIPRLLISAIAGFSFSFASAVCIALASTMLGCVVSFFYARFMGRALVRDIMSARMKNFEKLLIQHDFLAGIAIRAMPISNNTIVNLLAGVTGVRPLHYFAGSLIGYLPLTIVFVLAGSGIQQDLFGRILLSLALYLFVVVPIGYFLQKKVIAGNKTV